jgi:PAS domain S-box-containing protein
MEESPRDRAVVLGDVLITHELLRRSRRAPESAREADALHALVRDLADKPGEVLQLLVDIALDLCAGGSAGISLSERAPDGSEVFRWVALAGRLAAHAGAIMPGRESPCGVCLEHGALQLFTGPERYFACLTEVRPRIEEALVIPFHANGEARGAMWVSVHDRARLFDAEDARVMTTLAHFAGATVHRLDVESTLRRSEARMREDLLVARAIGDHVADAVFLLDAAGRVTFANRGAERLLGSPPGALHGRPLHDVVHGGPDGTACAGADCVLGVVVRTGAACQHEDVFIRCDGSRADVSCSSVAIDRGDATGGIVIVRDVSVRKHAEKERTSFTTRLLGLSAAAASIHSLSLTAALAVITEHAREIVGAHQAMTTLASRGDGGAPLASTSLSPTYEARQHGEFRPSRGLLAATMTDGDGDTLGHILLCDKYQGQFSAHDEALLRQLANIAAVAIQNAEQYERAQSARLAVEVANAANDEFLGMLASELRSPLAVILDGVSVLDRRGAQEPEAVRVRELIRHHTGRLARLLDDLLDMARISQGKIELRPDVVDVRAVIDLTVQAARERFEARGQRLSVSMPDASAYVYGDPARLQQIAGNLLDNASKHTPAGGAVWLSVERVNDEVLISVRDNGVGIPPDKLEAIFDLAQSDGGLGIGLTVVRRLTEMHGGRVHAHSDGRGTGSEFVVRLRAFS